MNVTLTLLNTLDTFVENILTNLGIWGALISCLLITVESILPILPVSVFITLVFYTFGKFFGFIISWVCTCLGCFLSFFLFRSKVKGWFEKRILNNKNRVILNKFMKFVDHVTFSNLALLIAIPFTPAFAVNIAAGLSNMKVKKFMGAIMLGKLFMVYFWGYIGTTLIESFTHPTYLVRIIVVLGIAFIVSRILNKYLKLD